jgi:ornithine cyclodeaminase/alanine dehydrogenase
MTASDTIILTGSEVESLLKINECIEAVENAFKMAALGKAMTPGVLAIHAQNGGFHTKAGILHLERDYFVAKTNANFPQNMKLHGLPTIQGVVVVSDASNGRLLALMDSIEITIIRTGAATAVAAKYLARKDASIVSIFGCGNQGKISLRALMHVRAIKTAYVYDIDLSVAQEFVRELGEELGISIKVAESISTAVSQSDICITCTTSKKYFIQKENVQPGTFIAAVGSDSEDKQELDPLILSSNKVVVDLLVQCEKIGELHHALDLGIMKREQVYSELGEIIAGQKKGRETDDDRALKNKIGSRINFTG